MQQTVGEVYSKTTPDCISLVITTYNRSDALVAVLQALELQTDRDFEVIVADDGSTDEHQQNVAQFAQTLTLPITHVWHPDNGFTAAQVRNMGVEQSRGNYIVLMDGDCVPEVDFVAQHRRLREPGCFVNGSRVLLSQSATEEVLRMGAPPAGHSAWYWLRQRIGGRANKVLPRLRLPDGNFRKQGTFVWKGIRSCNMAVWRDGYLAVNGFDETFVGWGHEDADFVLRLHNAGLCRKNGFAATEVYHLWHKESIRDRENQNARKVRDREVSGVVRAAVGITDRVGYEQMRVTSWR